MSVQPMDVHLRSTNFKQISVPLLDSPRSSSALNRLNKTKRQLLRRLQRGFASDQNRHHRAKFASFCRSKTASHKA